MHVSTIAALQMATVMLTGEVTTVVAEVTAVETVTHTKSVMVGGNAV